MEYFWITSPERGFIKLADELLPELLLSWLSTTLASVFSDVLLTAFFLNDLRRLIDLQVVTYFIDGGRYCKDCNQSCQTEEQHQCDGRSIFYFFSCRMKFHLHGVSIDG